MWASWQARKASDRPDLRGGQAYLDTPRNANYVDADTYQVVLADLRDRYGLGEVPASGPVRPVRRRLSSWSKQPVTVSPST